MKEDIINTAADLFLTYGFKSVTMDDLATRMGISKKTIYTHFSNKTKLVEACTMFILNSIETGIQNIREQQLDPIEEMFEIKKFVTHHLKDEKSSPQFQLQKYYPAIYKNLEANHFQVMQCCVVENLERGIKGGFFRPSISVDFISRIYFLGMSGIKNQDMFPVTEYPIHVLIEKYLEYHLRAIVTPKGFQKLKQYLTIED